MLSNVRSGSNFKYYKNGTWHDYDPEDYDRIELNKGEYVRFRGSDTVSNSSRGCFSIGRKVAASGNIMSLRLDSESRSQGLTDECFINLFSGCEGLITAPELPETTLAKECYDAMFEGCKNLTTAPALPATTLAYGCYADMFMGCKSLTEAPALPATSLATYCYGGMFDGCTSLTELPALPATTLANYCYSHMFSGCSNIRISDQPGTDDNGIKYSEEYRIPTAGDATNASYALDSMFYATGGKFKGTPSINTTYYIGKPVYTVKWKNGDTTLETDADVESGTAPSYGGETPTKASDSDKHYTFSGWSDGTNTYGLSDTLPNVTADVTYTAQFTGANHTWDLEHPVWDEDPTPYYFSYNSNVTFTCSDCGKTNAVPAEGGFVEEHDQDCVEGEYEFVTCVANFEGQDFSHTYYTVEPGEPDPTAHPFDLTAHAAKAATCTEAGNSAYWFCPVCNKYFSDEDGLNEIDEDSWVINALGHNKQHVAAKAADYNSAGNIEYWYCTRCEKYFSDSDCTNEITQAQTVVPMLTGAQAQVGDTKYGTLQDALDVVPNGGTIKLLADQTIDLQLAAGEEYTIDLNSYTLTVESSQNYNYIYGDLTIDDSSAAKTGKVVVDDYGIAPRAGGKLTVNSGAFTTADGYDYLIYLMGGELEVNGGTFTANHPVNCYSSGKKALGGKVVINGGEFTSTEYFVISGFENSNITINGGEFEGPYPLYVDKTSSLSSGFTPASATINAGTFTATNKDGYGDTVVDCESGASVTIKGGTFTGGELYTDDASDISVSGGTFDTDVDIYAAPGFVGTQLSDTTFGVKVDDNPLGLAPIIGFQQKAADEEHAQGVRIITKVGGCDLTQFDEYGYVVAKVSGKEQATANFNNLKAYGGNGEKTIKCNGTVNTIDGYGTPYVTLAVSGMTDGQQVAARFYAIKDGVTYYSNYVSTARYNGIIAAY